MASRASMEVTAPSSHHCIPQSCVITDSDIRGLCPDSQTLSAEEANDHAAEWQLYSNSLKHDLNDSQSQIRVLENELKSTKSRLESALQQRHYFNVQREAIVPRSFVAHALEQKEEIQQLKKEINEMTNKHDLVVSLWQDALQELDEAKLSKKYLVVDDDAMTSKWKQLQFVIKNLSTSYLYGIATSNISSVTAEELERYHQLMPTSNEYPTGSEYSTLCQIQIWDFITTRILSVPTIVLGRDAFESTERLFAIIRDGNRVPAGDFYTLRALIGEIIKTVRDVDLNVCDNLKADLKAQLRPFTSPESSQEISRQLDAIVDKAVNLAVIFIQSRCFYHVETMEPRSERPFDANTMDNVNGDGDGDGMQVYSIISPALFNPMSRNDLIPLSKGSGGRAKPAVI
ncbi:hypothetical protein F5B21DRAFT_505224 [Xylaria acuta]|nr:hypothetical protein F5B21DRAFT_505224 [Xylaria acuta]